MCLIVNNVEESVLTPLQTSHDKICYKVVLLYTNNEGNLYCCAPIFRDTVYEFKRTHRYSEKGISSKFAPVYSSEIGRFDITHGFHSYANFEDALNFKKLLLERQSFLSYCVVCCVIPAETPYYHGYVDTGFSEEIKPNGSLPEGFVSEYIKVDEIVGA